VTKGHDIFQKSQSAGKKRYPLECFLRIAAAAVILSLVIGAQPSVIAVQAAQPPGTSAAADILIEASSGTVLHEKNADKHMRIASTTKILTAIVVLENCDASEKVVIPKNFPAIEGSSIYLKPGEELTVLDLLYGTLLESGNDAAVALALHVSGSVEEFAVLMNGYAKGIGCAHSNFRNPHGLDQQDHYSTARDLALIAAEAMKNETFRTIVSTKTVSRAGRYFRNHNKLLWKCPGAVGIKTGFTESAGRSLVSCAERDGMSLICVTLNAPDDWRDHTGLYDWGFRNYGCINIAVSDEKYGRIPVISGVKEDASVHPAEDFDYVHKRADKTEVTCEKQSFVYAPVARDKEAGRLVIKNNGAVIKEIPLVYGETVKLDPTVPLTFFEKLKWSIFH
jgi:D-alanyl-D-alanine carboxypeptidase